MQFVGFWQWRKRGAALEKGAGGESGLRARRLSRRQWAWLAAGLLAGVAALYLILLFVDKAQLAQGRIDSVSKPKVLLDATVMALNIAGQVLLSFAFMEQWYIWILVNISSISLWAVTLMGPGASGNAAVMLVKYIFYLLNSLNGLRIWLNLSRRERIG
jgi:nicotinamide mononucleotide transporter